MNALLDDLLAPLNAPAFTSFGAPTTWVEVAGFTSGALCVWLVTRQHILNWPIGIANNVFFLMIFTTAGLYADAGLQLVYVALAAYGWWAWLHGGRERTALPVSRTSPRQWALLAVVGVLGTAALAGLLDTYTPSTVPLPDALTTVLSLLATWGMTRKKVESWFLWMAADVIYVPLYHHKGLTLTALLYVGFFTLCLVGLRSWCSDLRGAPGEDAPGDRGDPTPASRRQEVTT